MAGTLTIATLSDGTNSTSSTNCIQGSAKAWVQYNAVSQAILASYNVSSVTYSAAGQYVVNFTNAFADTKYAVTGCAGGATSAVGDNSAAILNIKQNSADSVSTGFVRIKVGYSDGTAVSYPYNSIAIFR